MDTKEREPSREDAEIADAEAAQAEANNYARQLEEDYWNEMQEQEQRWRDS